MTDSCKSHKPSLRLETVLTFPVLCSNLQIMLPLLSKVLKAYERYKPTILVVNLLIYRLGSRDCLFTTTAYDCF